MKKRDSMRAAIDNKTPPRQMHLECRSKKMHAESERLERINRENRILLQRIDYHNELRHPARIDCHLKQQGPKSLNILQREKRIKEIEAENQRIHNKLIAVKPHHSVHQLETEFIESRRALEHLCEYPVQNSMSRSSIGSSGRASRASRVGNTSGYAPSVRNSHFGTASIADTSKYMRGRVQEALADSGSITSDDRFNTEDLGQQPSPPKPPEQPVEEYDYQDDYDDDDFAAAVLDKEPRGNTFLTDAIGQ